MDFSKIELNGNGLEKPDNQRYFGEGVYKVIISKADAGETNSGTPYIEFRYTGANGEAESWSRVWLSAKSITYTEREIRDIAVHNSPNDESKRKMRLFFQEEVHTGQDLLSVALSLAKKHAEAWIYRQRQAEPYGTRDDGTPKYGYNVNFYGYDPTDYVNKQKAQHDHDISEAKKIIQDDDKPIDLSDIPF